jgi:hypothetical protein
MLTGVGDPDFPKWRPSSQHDYSSKYIALAALIKTNVSDEVWERVKADARFTVSQFAFEVPAHLLWTIIKDVSTGASNPQERLSHQLVVLEQLKKLKQLPAQSCEAFCNEFNKLFDNCKALDCAPTADHATHFFLVGLDAARHDHIAKGTYATSTTVDDTLLSCQAHFVKREAAMGLFMPTSDPTPPMTEGAAQSVSQRGERDGGTKKPRRDAQKWDPCAICTKAGDPDRAGSHSTERHIPGTPEEVQQVVAQRRKAGVERERTKSRAANAVLSHAKAAAATEAASVTAAADARIKALESQVASQAIGAQAQAMAIQMLGGQGRQGPGHQQQQQQPPFFYDGGFGG